MATAKELLALARRHIGESYVLGALAPKSNAGWRGPWDCAEFASWCVYQKTGALIGCRPRGGPPDRADAYTGYWDEDARRGDLRVIATGIAAATAGAFLLRRPGSAIGHIAISAGDGSTVEAHSSKRGVIAGKVDGRRWDCGLLVPGIEVVLAAEPVPVERPGLVLRVKKPLMSGDLVRRVQRALAARGYSPGDIDGKYGDQTAAAVRAFQLGKGLLPDGEVGGTTAKALGIGWYG